MGKRTIVIISAAVLLSLTSYFVIKKICETQIHPHGYWIDQKARHRFDESLAKALLEFLKNEKAKTVADFGAGAYGYYVKYLLDHLIPCDGYDGNPYSNHLSNGIVQVLDFSQKVDLSIKYDWVISLEVGEHIPQEFEKNFIENLNRHCKKGIILSWAKENQKGKGHVNCRNQEYIKNLFIHLGYDCDQEVENKLRMEAHFGWFRQNLMVFRKRA